MRFHFLNFLLRRWFCSQSNLSCSSSFLLFSLTFLSSSMVISQTSLCAAASSNSSSKSACWRHCDPPVWISLWVNGFRYGCCVTSTRKPRYLRQMERAFLYPAGDMVWKMPCVLIMSLSSCEDQKTVLFQPEKLPARKEMCLMRFVAKQLVFSGSLADRDRCLEGKNLP